MKRRLFMIVLGLSLILSNIYSQTISLSRISYELSSSDKTATVVSRSPSYSGDVTIPSTITYNNETYTVTTIGNSAFYYCTSLTSVSIPNTVTSIGYEAFRFCYNLTSITIPNSVTSIGIYAFNDCDGLTSITIPSSVTYLGESAIGYCNNLISAELLCPITSISNDLCRGCSSLTDINIPNTVTSIGNGAFGDCDALTSIIIPESVTTIGYDAFYSCDNLTSIIIPNSVTSIGYDAFQYCRSLTSAKLSNQLTAIPNRLFDGCSVLKSIAIPVNVTSIGDFAFPQNGQLDTIIIDNPTPPTVTQSSFYNNSFYDNVKLYVPLESVSAYGSAPFWSDFLNIIPNVDITVNADHGVSTIEFQTQTVEITITPDYGYHFTQWSDGNTDNPRIVTVSSAATYTALFGKNQYTLTAIPSNTAYGFVQGSTTQYYLDTIVISASAYEGYEFTQWSDGNKNNPRSVVLTKDSTFTAEFVQSDCRVSIQSNIPNACNLPEPLTVDYLGTVDISVTPNYGYYFVQWSDGNLNNPRTVEISKDTVFTAEFAKNQYTLTVNSNNQSEGSVTGSATQEYLDTLVISATPNTGYHFDRWSDGFTSNPRSIVLTKDTTFTAFFAKNIYSLVVNSSNEAYGTADGSGSFEYQTFARVTATPNYGYHFTQWSDGSTYNPRDIYITEDVEITAEFAKNLYYLSVNTSNFYQGSVSGNGSGEYLDTLMISANPQSGYQFNQWSDGNTDNPRYVVITQDTTFTAQFGIRTYNLVVNASNDAYGTVQGAGSFEYQTNTTISATPNYGYYFVQWSDGNTDNPRDLVITEDVSFTAEFAKNQYNLTVYSSNPSLGSVEGSTSADYLDTLVISATANYGYQFHQWSDGNTDNPRTIVLTQDTIFMAQFGVIKYNLVVNASNDDYGSIQGAGSFEYQTNTTISAVPNYGYHFVQWSDGNLNNPRSVVITQDTSFTAEFAKNQYDLTVLILNQIFGSVEGTATGYYLDTLEISATANYGYHFTQWSDGNTDNPRSLVLTQDSILSAHFANNIYQAEVEVNNSVACDKPEPSIGAYLDTIQVQVNPNPGYHFVQWSDGNTDNPRNVVLTQDSLFTAEFAINQYAVVVNASNNNYGTVEGSDTLDYLSSITISATANYGYHFAQWSDGNTDNPRDIVITQDSVITAVFAKNQYSLTVTSANAAFGYAQGTATKEYLDTASIAATATQGYHFTQWSDGNTDNPRNVVITQDTSFTAEFAISQYSIIVNASNDEYGTVQGSDTLDYLSLLTISATANYGYHFAQWSDGNTDNPRNIVITQDSVITAVFAKNRYTLIVNSANAERGATQGSATQEYLDVIVISASANYGYHFTQWSDGNTDNPRSVELTQDTSFMAEFDKNIYQVTIQSSSENVCLVSETKQVAYLDTVSFSVTLPDVTYRFSSWDDGNADYNRSEVVTKDITYNAIVSNLYFLSATTEHGRVEGAGVYPYGSYVTLIAYPEDGYTFVKWSDGSKYNPYTLVLDKDITLEAIMEPVGSDLKDAESESPKAIKILKDGIIYIIKNGHTYDLYGTLIDSATK